MLFALINLTKGSCAVCLYTISTIPTTGDNSSANAITNEHNDFCYE
jgi:hypothetical protein